ncbi:MAG: TIGR00374 family protein [Bacteroidetes bacterium CG12_big_fil_rev_8_21_14_0_65_60_17]|nr:MAG: TIGR00374 family protein [Bacteroidetes bacterium CG12_big_fil_rev_8_21_14_0_65_60_17]
MTAGRSARAALRTWLIRLGSFVLAGLLLWLALRGADWEAVWDALRSANYFWVPPVVIVTIGAHWLRAVRWCIMMDALPEARQPTRRSVAFASLLVGYMANYAGPRLGELIRAGNVARYERLSFSSLMGTVVAERVLDVLTLAAGLATLPLIYGPELGAVVSRLVGAFSGVETASWWLVAAGGLVAALAGLWILFREPGDGTSRLGAILDTFRDGLLAVTRTGRSEALVGLTVAIWLCYAFMAWVPFAMLGYTTLFGISPLEAWALMIIGSFGVVLPAPGGIGTYHVITVEALALLHAMPGSEAATYALLTHTGQMVIYVLAGFAALIWIGPRLAHKPVDTEVSTV